MNLGKQYSYCKKYLFITKELFAFADKYRGLYSDSIADANEFYRFCIYISFDIPCPTSVSIFWKFFPHCKRRAKGGDNLIKMSGSHLCIPRNEAVISKTEL